MRWASTQLGRWTLLGVLIALAVTVVCQALAVTIQSPVAFTILHTSTGLAGALAAFLLVGRPEATRRVRSLVIALALAILAATDLAIAAEQAPLSTDPTSAWLAWLLGAQLAGAAILLLAAFYPRRALDLSPGPPGVLLAGVLVLAIATFDHLLVSSSRTGALHASEILELCAYALICWGCLLEFRLRQLRLAQSVAASERRRMARDMHDGLAQELAFIATNAQRLGRGGDDAAMAQQLKAAAERALHDSRMTIAVLSSPDGSPLEQLIANTASSFEARFGVAVDLDLERGVIVDAERRNALLRIVHEALTNAVRHGGARRIAVKLSSGLGGLRLLISDDGRGFDVAAARGAGRGFGLTSMSERAQLLGGEVHITSSAGAGTVVEVTLP